MISFDFNKSCTGCQACADVCITECITFHENSDGFIIPKVDSKKCCNCRRCEKVCPYLNSEVENVGRQSCYLAYNMDEEIRHSGSSGSVFFSLAESILSKGGVVYGASMDENLQLSHVRTTDLKNVRKLMKSKYIQSNTSGIYKQVLDDLRCGLRVLFVGTPCQCKALYNLISIDLRKNLLIVDFICHGVPSQYLFNESIKCFESINLCKVIDFSFREKSYDKLRRYKIVYRKQNGSISILNGDIDSFPYYYGFCNQLTKRESCYKCAQRSCHRASDITLGDFWGIDIIRPNIKDFVKGYSSVITNNKKGEMVINSLTSCFVEEIPDGVDFIKKRNRAYIKTEQKSFMRKLFFVTMHHKGYPFVEKYFLQKRPSSFIFRLIRSLIFRFEKLYTQQI